MTDKSSDTLIQDHEVVARDEWIAARRELLRTEKEFMRRRDELSRQRRKLPWVKVEKDYVFDSPRGKVALAELFEGRSQLVVYHFMFHPDWREGCPSCSFVADHLDGTLPHLAARDVSLVVVSQAPLAKIEPFKKRMGWRFRWVSSFGSDFNYDYHVSFTPEQQATGKVDYNYALEEFPSLEGPGASVFYKGPQGEIFHTYSTYARGLEPVMVTYALLDLVPRGRNEDELSFSQAWLRHHDRYGTDLFLDPTRPYWPPLPLPTSSASSSTCVCGSADAGT
jgi:predicted dithiol-disulfide oxidoreductase (DUF899 family)